MTPKLFGMVCLVGAVAGVGASAYFWASGSPATGVVLVFLTVLLLPSVGWRRAQGR